MDIREFKNTYSEYAPSVVWDWCVKPTSEEIDAQLEKFSVFGISEVFIRPSKGLVVPYLSEDYFELIRTAARRSARYGLSLWIFDENCPHSGNGGGEITSVADYRIRSFVKTDKRDVEKTDVVLSEDGQSVYVLRDMSTVIGKKRVPIADITDEFTVRCFLEEIYDKYIRACKRFLGHEIKGVITEINMPEEEIVFSDTAVKKLGGKDAAELAKKLIKNDSAFEKEYFGAYNRCIWENFTTPISEKCHENELSLSVSVKGNENISRQLNYVLADKISLTVKADDLDFTQIKLAEAISAQFGKPLTVKIVNKKFSSCSERYNKAAFITSFGATVSYDSTAFSLTDRRKYEEGTIILSEFSEKDISERLSRLAKVACETDSAADVLVIYSAEHRKYFSELCRNFVEKGVAFHLVEESILASHGRIFEDKISIGKCEYKTVIYIKGQDCIPKIFKGKRMVLDSSISASNCNISTEESTKISADKKVCINRRKDDNNVYTFVTAFSADVKMKVSSEKSVFAADSSNGEIYELEKDCEFTLRAGKTVLIIESDILMVDSVPPYTDELQFKDYENSTEIPFVLTMAGENILPLKTVNACFGKKSYRESDVDSLHREFYLLNNGETVKVKYPFFAELDKIGEVKLYIENAENLDFAELNGKRIETLVPNEKDPRFSGADVTKFLSNGKNTVALEYKKYNNYTPDFSSYTPAHFTSFNITSFESVYLCGDFDAEEGKLTRLEEYENDVTKTGMPFYHGALTYQTKLPENDLADSLLKVHGNFDICSIRIGKREKLYYTEVPSAELFNLDAGTIVEITVFNTPYNLLRTSDENAKPFGIEKIEICK